MMARAGSWALVAASLAVLGAGCGDDRAPREDRRTAVETTDRDELPDEGPAGAFVAWIDALSREDAAAACALQAPEFTIDLRYDAILVDRAQLGDPCTGFEALLWEDTVFDDDIVDIEITQETDEDALLDVALATRDLTVRMVYHRARWRVFSTGERTEPTDPGTTDAGPSRWLAAWCSLSPDQTREEIAALMGPPSGEYTVSDGGEPQLWWAQDQYDFRVYLDPVDGSVLELIGDYDALDADDRALLPCPELRR